MQQLALWRDVALVLMAVQCLVGVVIMLALTYVLVRLLNVAQEKAKIGATAVQKVTRRVAVETDRASVRIAEPVVKMRTRLTRTSSALRSFVPGFSLDSDAKPPAPPRGGVQQ